jgi:hypothetical protein
MIRKNIRLRKEYLIRMEDEKKNKQKYDKKMSLKMAQIGIFQYLSQNVNERLPSFMVKRMP